MISSGASGFSSTRASTMPSDILDCLEDLVGQREQGLLVLADELDVDRRRFAFIQGAADQAARIEGELERWKAGRSWLSP